MKTFLELSDPATYRHWLTPGQIAFLRDLQRRGVAIAGFYNGGPAYEIVFLHGVRVLVHGDNRGVVATDGEIPEALAKEGETLGFTNMGSPNVTKWRAFGDPTPVAPAAPPTTDINALNPGIRRVVAWLNERGFVTVDSGDGKTHEHECDRDYPYVVIRASSPMALVDECDRLLVELGPLAHLEGVAIQGNYDPNDGYAFIDLRGLDDTLLPPAVTP